MFSNLSSTVLVSRLAIRARLTSRSCSYRPSSNEDEKSKLRSVSIGGLTKLIKTPKNPELVPMKYLPKDEEIPTDTLKQLRWMMQKDLLGQDIFLIGRPGPLRRKLALQYLELTQRELEFVSLSRDTTESDLKQRREISSGTAFYIDQSAVRAASEGRILVLEGIEKAERNVLPVLNNLLENREMHLEDGRLLIPAARYDKLLEEHTQEELDKWQLVRVSEDFRVIALGLPVPQYIGNPLDPPLRSRFQAKDIRYLPFSEQLDVLKPLAPKLLPEEISKILSFAHTLMTDEASNLGLPDFPIENLPAVVSALNSVPNISPIEAIERLYPYKLFLPPEGCASIEQTLETFYLTEKNPQRATSIETVRSSDVNNFSNVEINVGRKTHSVTVASGNRTLQQLSTIIGNNYVSTAYHEALLAELMISHSVKDFCIVGPRGCGKSLLAERLGSILGYDVEPVQLYQDMTARDLLQQRTTLDNGDTVWRYSPLVQAAVHGRIAILDGIHRIHRGTLAVLHRLVHDRELQLYDGTRLLRSDRYKAAKEASGGLTDKQMRDERKIVKIQENFRIIALAEPPELGGSGKGQWLTPEILSMFLFHSMRPLSQAEELTVLERLSGQPGDVMKSILNLTHRLRDSQDGSLTSIASSLSTRQLLRISKRLKLFPEEDAYHAIHKACLARFLPTLARETLEKEMSEIGIFKTKETEESIRREKENACKVDNGMLTIGSTTAPVYRPLTKTKIPETLFYDTYQNISSMEALLRDFMLGEHLLLVGNQGVGKNKLVDRLLNLLNRPREYIQLHRDTTVQSLTLQPTVIGGVIVYEDSPLVKAVKQGHILVVDEADKAPLHVTCILKTLVESGEMMLSDGRRIVSRPDLFKDDDVIVMHEDFRMIVLANRPGFPFLGNDFFASLGDLFSCHAIDNPSMEAELAMLRQYGPDVPENTLNRLVKAFSELRYMADEGQIQYPYSTREVVNIVKHLQLFPNEGLGNVVRNVFDFDSYDKEARDTVNELLHKHGIPIGSSPQNVSLARQFELPERQLIGHWDRKRKRGHFMQLPVETRALKISSPVQVTVHKDPLDRIEARGLGFSELQSYWSLPFHDYAIVGDVAVIKDQHGRQLQDTIHVVTSNPVWMYAMKATDNKCSRLALNHLFDIRKQNVIPRIRLTPLGGKFESLLALHEEVSNTLLLVNPTAGSVLKIGSSNLLDSVKDFKDRLTGAGRSAADLYRLNIDFANSNKLLFFTPEGGNIELIDLNDEPVSHRLELPMQIRSLHPLSEHQYLIVTSGNSDDDSENLFILKKQDENDAIPTVLNPIEQDIKKGHSKVEVIPHLSAAGLSNFGLKMALNESVTSPNTILTTEKSFATIAMGFPELEFSPNEIYSWPKSYRTKEPLSTPPGSKKYLDPSRNIIFLRDSCQIVKPVSARDLPTEFTKNNHGLTSPGNVAAYLEVVDLADSKLRYIPIPDPVEMSVYASWYKKTYPDQVVSCAAMSNDGLVTVDNAGTVRLWETGTASLEKSILEWRKMIGAEADRDLLIQRDIDPNGLQNLDPKHGKVDETGAPHVGGNTWAGGTGGRGTAGLGGLGGPYRLDAGHDVHQVSDEMKAQVPEEVLKAARQMNRKAYEERLRQIKMSKYDAEVYEKFSCQVRKQVQALRLIISGLQAKAKDRQWLKNQTMGELDDTKLIEGITGEKSIYKKRGELDPEPGAPQEKPKRLRLVVDVSGSMYRFNGHDLRLERTLESALMVMEALEGHEEKFKFDIFGHSGEESSLAFVRLNQVPKNEKERLEVLQSMSAHSQFCMSGDHTLSATVQAINELTKTSDDYDESFVIVLSDANFDRYGISPSNFAKILKRSNDVAAFAIFIGSLGDQANTLAKKLPSGKGFVALDTKRIPEIMKTIFTSTMLK